MPDRDETKEAKKTKEGSAVEEEAKTTVEAVKTAPPWPLITIGVFATIVIVAIVVAGWVFVVSHRAERNQMGIGMMGQTEYGSGRYFSHSGFRRSGGGMLQAAAARGVVTAINGDTITVAGEGKSITVKKTSSTTIGGDKTDVAVNDTVVIYGTTNSDESVDATRIMIRNTSPADTLMDGAGGADGTPGA